MADLIAAIGFVETDERDAGKVSTIQYVELLIGGYTRHFGLWLSPVGPGWSLVGPMKRRMGRALGVGPGQRAVVG